MEGQAGREGGTRGRGVVDRPQTRVGRAKGLECRKGLEAGPCMYRAWTRTLGAGLACTACLYHTWARATGCILPMFLKIRLGNNLYLRKYWGEKDTFLSPTSAVEVIETVPPVCVSVCVGLLVLALSQLAQGLTLRISCTSSMVKVIGQNSRSPGQFLILYEVLKISVIQSDIRALPRIDYGAPMCRHKMA